MLMDRGCTSVHAVVCGDFFWIFLVITIHYWKNWNPSPASAPDRGPKTSRSLAQGNSARKGLIWLGNMLDISWCMEPVNFKSVLFGWDLLKWTCAWQNAAMRLLAQRLSKTGEGFGCPVLLKSIQIHSLESRSWSAIPNFQRHGMPQAVWTYLPHSGLPVGPCDLSALLRRGHAAPQTHQPVPHNTPWTGRLCVWAGLQCPRYRTTLQSTFPFEHSHVNHLPSHPPDFPRDAAESHLFNTSLKPHAHCILK